jgi:bifunctional DNA-binding transcriptional regulator/antitoxin component of YhaV-PrlF toxin-antitoxin module
VKLFGVSAFTERAQDLVSFTSRIDKKGRVLISARIRKILRLSYGSRILVKVNSYSFISKVDERGRFSIPTNIRGDSLLVEGKIGRCNL